MKRHLDTRTNEELDKDPFAKNTHCRFCGTELNLRRIYHTMRKYCSDECKSAYRLKIGREKAKAESIKLAELKKNYKAKLLNEPEMVIDDLKNISISLNMIIFPGDNDIKCGARIGLMGKIRNIGAKYEMLPMFKNVEILKNGVLTRERRRYNTMHITAVEFFKIVEHHRNLYLSNPNYIHLNSYKHAIENFKCFKDYIENLQIIKGTKK